MTTDTPENEASQPEQVQTLTYSVTVERIYIPEDLPEDDRRGSYTSAVPEADSDELSSMYNKLQALKSLL